MEELLLEIKAKGYTCTLIQSETQYQCNISLGSRLNYVCYCDTRPMETLQGAWSLAQELKPPEPKTLPDLADLLDFTPNNID